MLALSFIELMLSLLVHANDDKVRLYVGNRDWMKKNGIQIDPKIDQKMTKHETQGQTAVLCAVDSKLSSMVCATLHQIGISLASNSLSDSNFWYFSFGYRGYRAQQMFSLPAHCSVCSVCSSYTDIFRQQSQSVIFSKYQIGKDGHKLQMTKIRTK